MFNVGPKIVKPSQSATFPTSLQSWSTTKAKQPRNKENFKTWKRDKYMNIAMKWVNLCFRLNLTSFLWKCYPIPTSSIFFYVLLKLWVFFWWPWTFLDICLITTRSPPHHSLSLSLSLSLCVCVCVGVCLSVGRSLMISWISSSLFKEPRVSLNELWFGWCLCLIINKRLFFFFFFRNN